MTEMWWIDAFTSRPFAGNPAAVAFLDRWPSDAWLAAVAREMNLSETAFLVPGSDAGRWQLRWFTPATEVELCGHATLASAHVLWEDGHLAAGETARFFTASGTLTAEQRDDWIELDFPAEPAEPCPLPAGLEAALGAEPTWVGHNRFDYLVELATEAEVRSLAPDVAALERIDARGFVVTSPATTAPFDFVSRFFAPHVGIAEDPVTGSAHCCLGPYWAEKLGKRELVGYQASKRGGVVRVRPEGERVKLLGQAVTVLRMELV
jgi:PhzF family phenazine biosynthesis protein